jgi:DNA-binding CsgD family transcriptional regulator
VIIITYFNEYNLDKIINYLFNSSVSFQIYNEYFKNIVVIVTDELLKTKSVYSKRNDIENLIKQNISCFSEESIGINVISVCSNVRIGILRDEKINNHRLLETYFSAAHPISNNEKVIGYLGLFSNTKLGHFYCLLFLEMFSKLVAKELQKCAITEELILNVGINNEWVKKFELTKRECEVIELIMDNCIDSEISTTLNISISTVRAHINSIFKKINVNSKIDLLNFVYKEKINIFKNRLVDL